MLFVSWSADFLNTCFRSMYSEQGTHALLLSPPTHPQSQYTSCEVKAENYVPKGAPPPPVGSIYFFSRCKSECQKTLTSLLYNKSRSFIPSIHCIRQTTNSLHTIILAATESAWILQLCNLQIIDSINIFAWYRNLISKLSIFPVGLLRLRTNY